jgi:uncharacterized Zn finger protein (UPF0148 family)
MLKVMCPACNAPMPYVPELAGREVFCLGCGSHFVVPKLDEAPARAANQPLKLERLFPTEPPQDSAGEPKGPPKPLD